MTGQQKPSTASLVGAFAIVYIVWGSTFLGIRVGIETIPPLYLAGVRFLVAGAILHLYCRLTNAPKPASGESRGAAVVGILMLTFGNGAVCWAEQRMSSGLAALFVANVPMWLLLQNWVWGAKRRPSTAQVCGLIIGLCGVSVLVLPANATTLGKSVDIVGAVVILCGSFSWSLGTMRAKMARAPDSPLMWSATQMLAGGAALLMLGTAFGEFREIHHVAMSSVIGLGYLIVFGSVIGYVAYNWLNRNTTPARLATYAYVNPVVAILLGSALLGEPFTLRTALAIVLVIGGVVMLSARRAPRRKPVARPLDAEAAMECG